MSFVSAYSGALVVQAHETNYYGPDSGRPQCVPRAIVLHTPEEPADDYESTPVYFAQPSRQASTRWYLDNDGDLYNLVPEPWGAIANGLEGKPAPVYFAPFSLNLQTDNIEIEGYAHSLHQTMTQQQWASLVDWCVWCCLRWNIRPDRQHILAHYDLSIQRSDPGPWLLDKSPLVREVEARVNQYEKDVKELKGIAAANALRLNGQEKLLEAILPPLAAGDDQTAEQRLRYIYTAAGKPYPA